MTPGLNGAWRGAAGGLALAAGVVILLTVGEVFFGALAPLIATAVLLSAGAVLAGLAALMWRVLRDVPRRFIVLLLLVLPTIGLPFVYAGRRAAVITAIALALVAATAGGLIGAGLRGWRRGSRSRRHVHGVQLLGGLLLVAMMSYMLFGPGPQMEMRRGSEAGDVTSLESVGIGDPAARGSFKVQTLTYGAGTPYRIAEYGEDASLLTSPVDGRALLSSWRGVRGAARTRYWGFGPDQLPLNGTVYYPDAPGPFPLVILVHGNYMMQGRSDRSFDYLAPLLASRGYVAVTIDQNFLNSAWFNTFGESPATVARGWLVLEHLRQWRRWSQEVGNPFAGRVDLERIALVGHSRGGEAIAVAAALNRMPRLPEDSRIPVDGAPAIRTLVAIAPVDGQYMPAGRRTELRDVNYLTLHGAFDGDVTSFAGASQYKRVHFSGEDEWVKAAILAYNANHSGFTSEWIGTEKPAPSDLLFRRTPVMPPAAQQRIAAVYTVAFLELTLNRDERYLPLLRDARVGRQWLPRTIYLTESLDSRALLLADFEEDTDASRGSVPGVGLEGRNLAEWRELDVVRRWGATGNHAVAISWQSADASYEVSLPRAVLTRAPATVSLAVAVTSAGADNEPVDFTVSLVDGTGRVASVPISRWARVQPPLKAPYMKFPVMSRYPPTEVAFQTIWLPMGWFAEANPSLDLLDLISLRIDFDRSPAGQILLDDIALRLED